MQSTMPQKETGVRKYLVRNLSAQIRSAEKHANSMDCKHGAKGFSETSGPLALLFLQEASTAWPPPSEGVRFALGAGNSTPRRAQCPRAVLFSGLARTTSKLSHSTTSLKMNIHKIRQKHQNTIIFTITSTFKNFIIL